MFFFAVIIISYNLERKTMEIVHSFLFHLFQNKVCVYFLKLFYRKYFIPSEQSSAALQNSLIQIPSWALNVELFLKMVFHKTGIILRYYVMIN